MLVPPPRLARPVRTFRLRRRLLLTPALGIAILLVVVSFGGARLGERIEAARTGPQLGDLRAQLREATTHAAALADSIATLRATLDAVAEERERRTAAAAATAAAIRAGRPVPGVVLPVRGRITSRFARSRVHPILRIPRPHRGLDIAAPSGTTITTPAAGRVTKVAREMGYGLVVHVDHGGGVTTRYAHCRSALVSPGDVVAAGTAIATVGRTGLASAPHVHYEVRVRGEAVDPMRVAVVGTR